MPEQQNIEHKPIWQNASLKWGDYADACFMAGYIDTWGRGTLKIIDACLKAGLPEPVIKEMDGGIQITMFLSEVAESGLVDGLVERLVERLVDGLAENQKKMVYLISENGGITIKEMAKSLSISTTAVDNNLKRLKNKNIIRRVGSDTDGSWEIIQK
jgi:ATP-dependent DNA helicase RecG